MEAKQDRKPTCQGQRFSVRTDLALEARELVSLDQQEVAGVRYSVRQEGQYKVVISSVEVMNEEGERTLGKAKGRYVTLGSSTLVMK